MANAISFLSNLYLALSQVFSYPISIYVQDDICLLSFMLLFSDHTISKAPSTYL